MGLGIGTAYGLVRPSLGEVSKLRAGAAVLCLAAMAGSDGPTAALGVMDLKQMGLNAWLSGIVSHLAYGLATVVDKSAALSGKAW